MKGMKKYRNIFYAELASLFIFLAWLGLGLGVKDNSMASAGCLSRPLVLTWAPGSARGYGDQASVITRDMAQDGLT